MKPIGERFGCALGRRHGTAQAGRGEDRLLADIATSAAMRRGGSRRSQDEMQEGQRQALTVSASIAGAQSAAVCRRRAEPRARPLGADHDVGGDAGERQHAAAIDEERRIWTAAPQRQLPHQHGLNLARDARGESNAADRIVGPERARHDVADRLDRRIGAGEARGDDDPANSSTDAG